MHTTSNLPDNGTCLVIYLDTGLVDIFSIRFHVSLLKVGGKAVHVLIVGQNGQRFGTEKAVGTTTTDKRGVRSIQIHHFNDESGDKIKTYLLYQIPSKAKVRGKFSLPSYLRKC